MANILIVDDSPTDQRLAGRLLERESDFSISYAENGSDALEQIAAHRPDVVVADLLMPEMDGLQLVEAMRRNHPSVPVVLMTARGSEQIAAEALRVGAAGYVPKTALATNLPQVVRRLFHSSAADRLHSRLFHSLQCIDCRFQLHNDPELIAPLVARIQEMLRCLPLGDEAERLRVSTAVGHGLWIAHNHGNLEIDPASELTDREFQEDAARRCREAPATERSIELHAQIDRHRAKFEIRHQGAAINPSALPGDLESNIADRTWLSSFVLLPTIMDEVNFSNDGREITLLKRAVRASEPELEVG